jgi:hypothetical protein
MAELSVPPEERRRAEMRYGKGIGTGLILFGLMVVINSGLAVGAAATWGVLGLAVVLLGVTLVAMSWNGQH